MAAQLGIEADGLRPLDDRRDAVATESELDRSPWLSPDLLTTVRPRYLGDVVVAHLPWRRGGALSSALGAAPELGAHTDVELRDRLGLDDARVDELRRRGALT